MTDPKAGNNSPMSNPALHDTLVLLIKGKRYPLPGVARVTVGLAANIDVQTPPADGKQVTQLNEATADVTVALTMWTAEQWKAYQDVLLMLRKGTGTGPAVFTTVHPEIWRRGVKQLYFVSEQSEPYSPMAGYKVSIKFAEKLKEGTPTAPPSTEAGTSTALGLSGTPESREMGVKLLAAARANGAGTPAAKTRRGDHTIADGGYCSSWERVVGVAAGYSPSLYGENARETERLFKVAKLSVPWSSAVQSQLQPGSTIFYANDPSGSGHVGTFVGYRPDGTPMVLSNNLVTYRARGGLLDSAGRPTGYDAFRRKVDARGEVPLTGPGGLGTPTSVAPPGLQPLSPRLGPNKPPVQPKAVPLPTPRPSQKIPSPPAAAFRPAAPSLISKAFNVTPPKPFFPNR